MILQGAYTADRAAALAGVPKSTVHYWARERILVPSVSAEKVRRWSYTDLISLRVIHWLRRRKATDSGHDIPATSMASIRRALAELRALDKPTWTEDRPALLVDGDGHVYFSGRHGLQSVEGQLQIARDELALTAPFSTPEGTRGPDLIKPRPQLRIIPGKLSGSPHVVDTRVETRGLAALIDDGFDTAGIVRLYPFLTSSQVNEAIELELQLSNNLSAAA